jgi:hypothetical protein
MSSTIQYLLDVFYQSMITLGYMSLFILISISTLYIFSTKYESEIYKWKLKQSIKPMLKFAITLLTISIISLIFIALFTHWS